MKLSTRTRYGVRLMVALAVNYGKTPVFLKDIARGENISEKYLSLIIIPLRGVGKIHPGGTRGIQSRQRTFADYFEGDCGCFGRRLFFS